MNEASLNYPPLDMPDEIKRPEPRLNQGGQPFAFQLANSVDNVLDFFGPSDTSDSGQGFAAKGKRDATQEALQIAKDHAATTGEVTYLEPGEVLPLPGAKNRVHCFVLGPPRNDWIKRSDANKSEIRNKEAYGHAFALGIDASFLAAVERDDGQADESFQPFTDAWAIHLSEGPKNPFLARNYYADSESWRTIDEDWLTAAGPLALKLDSDTNNTSLVLAFELEPDGDVLLFPGDAQVGNWRS